MILALNYGSSSIRYKLFDNNLIQIIGGEITSIQGNIDFVKSLNEMINKLSDHKDKITSIGYRIVHGGPLKSPTLLDQKSMKIIAGFSQFAPLHNPNALRLVKLMRRHFNRQKHYAVFDTSFFHDLPEVSKIIPIDQHVALKYKIIKYGFHGINHQYIAKQVDSSNRLKIITLHLGSGCSAAAIKNGQPIETSMSFTPNDGLMMRTRSGSIDPGVVIYLAKRLGINKTEEIIQRSSGLAGLTDSSGDLYRILISAGLLPNGGSDVKNIDKDLALFAVHKFVYEIRKVIGSYDLLLGNADLIAFSGKIGFESEIIRDKIIEGSRFSKNQIVSVEANEEKMIAEIIINHPPVRHSGPDPESI